MSQKPSVAPLSIETLLGDPTFRWASVAAVLHALAAVGRAPHVDPSPEVVAFFRAGLPSELAAGALGGQVERHVRSFLRAGEPEGTEDQERWLDRVEALALACRGAERLRPHVSWAGEVADALSAGLRDLSAVLKQTPWLAAHGAAAEAARAALGEPILPWSAVARGASLGQLGPEEAVAAWVDARLDAAASKEVRRQVGVSGSAWQRAYRRIVSDLARQAHVVPWTAAWSLDVARSEEDLGAAQRVLAVPLPHVGAGAALEARLHERGLFWADPQAGTRLVRLDVPEVVWGDEITGPVRTRIVVERPDVLDDLWHGLCALRSVVEGGGGARATSIALAIAGDLEAGHLHGALVRGAALLEAEDEPDEEALHGVIYALEARVLLERALAAVDEAALASKLVHVDEANEELTSAVQLLPQASHDAIVGVDFADPTSWWGRRASGADARFDQAISAWGRSVREGKVEDPRRRPVEVWRAAPAESQPGALSAESFDAVAALDDLARTAGHERHESFEHAFGELGKLPCAWMRNDVRAALDRVQDVLAGTPEEWMTGTLRGRAAALPGRAPLLAYRKSTNEGLVLEVRVRRLRDGERSATPPAQLDVRSVRAAYDAAARVLPSGLPPYMLDEHTVEVIGVNGPIDGRSADLPVALAFLSYWIHQPLQCDVAATGELRPLHRGAEIRPVGGVDAKARALSAWHAGAAPRLIMARENASVAPGTGVVVCACATLREAATLSGLQLDTHASPLRWGGVDDRRRRLEEYCDDVESQSIRKYAIGGMDPWYVMADRMRLLVRSLAREPAAAPHRARIDGAALLTALAFTHAGDDQAAAEVVADVTVSEGSPPALRVLRRILELNQIIDDESREDGPEVCEGLSAALEELPAWERHLLQGKALGTMGRFWMHRRELPQALSLLRSSVEEHACHIPHEVGRSRVYHAMALRMAGRHHEAAGELDRAEKELDTLTRSMGASYLESCMLYWRYERARLMVEMERPPEALRHARAALADTEWRGFWPRLGILRTLSWAYRLASAPLEAAACVAEMRRLEVPERAHTFAAAVLDEATRDPFPGGIVY